MFSWTWATGTLPACAGSIRLNTMTRENGDLITTKELNGLFKRVGHHHLHNNRYHQRVKVFTLSPLSLVILHILLLMFMGAHYQRRNPNLRVRNNQFPTFVLPSLVFENHAQQCWIQTMGPTKLFCINNFMNASIRYQPPFM
jgi:hypothetical protein